MTEGTGSTGGIAVVQSGGGAKGAWQAGVWKAMAELKAIPDDIRFSIGTSVGGLHAIGVAMHPPKEGQIEKIASYLEMLWFSIEGNQSIYKQRFPPWICGLTHNSLLRTWPLKDLLTNFVIQDAVRTSGVKLRVTGVDMLSGDLHILDETWPDLVQAGMITSSFPGEFEPIDTGEFLFTDGGIRDVAPLGQAIDSGCHRIVVLLCTPREPEPVTRKQIKNLPQFVKRVVDIMCNEILLTDLKACERGNDLAQYGHPDFRPIRLDVLEPSEILGDPLDFSPKLIRARFDQGYADGKAYWSAKRT